MIIKLQSPIKIRKGEVISSFGSKDLPPDWIPLNVLNDLFGGGGRQLKDFLEVPELNNIINIRARAMASGAIDAVSKTTGEQQKANQSLVRVLRNPNWFQGEKEFWRQSSLWRDIFGNEYVYFLTPVGMPNSFKGMFTLNPSLVKISYKPKDSELFFMNETDEGVKYSYTWKGKEITLDKESLIHLNDNRVQATKLLEGTSKIDSLQANIKNIRAAYAKRNIALSMPIGIISNNAQGDAIGTTLPMNDEEKKAVQNRLKIRGADPILTSMMINYDNMEINAQRMGLFEETREDTTKICDAYGVPYDILASQKGSTFANLKEAKKQMYEETIIPDVNEKVNSINNHIGSESLSWEVRADFSHLPVFSEDKKEMAATNSVTMRGIDIVLKMPITDDGKIAILVDTYGYTKEVATVIVKPKESETAGVGTGENVQVQSLNGAQVQAMVELVIGVQDGTIPRTSAINILMVSFGLTQAQANSIV